MAFVSKSYDKFADVILKSRKIYVVSIFTPYFTKTVRKIAILNILPHAMNGFRLKCNNNNKIYLLFESFTKFLPRNRPHIFTTEFGYQLPFSRRFFDVGSLASENTQIVFHTNTETSISGRQNISKDCIFMIW